MEAPIPQPRLDDDEDVHWALSTAVALWGRGERTEALKWLRRAAEQASDVNADKRALELFKAAAEVANQVKSASAPPAPAPTPVPPPAPPAPPSVEAAPAPAPAPAPGPRPPPAPPPRRPGSMYPPPPVAAAPVAPRPPSVPAPPPAGRAPAPPIPRSAPPPPVAPSSAPRQAAPSPARPPVPITPPVQPVAITAAKPAPAAIAPKRRRSFTGEARPAQKGTPAADPRARSAPAQPPKHRRRTHGDDDLHVPDRTHGQPATSIFDDLDEDTRVISNKHKATDEIDQALERLRYAPVPAPPLTEPGRPPAVHEELTSDGSNAPPESGTTAPGRPRPGEASPPTERPGSAVSLEAAAAPRAPAAKRLDTLPALRVAVLGTGIAGEVRLISLDANDEPPPGAAVAVLVPLSNADGEAVARLFGAIE